jgi:hypothetical protein
MGRRLMNEASGEAATRLRYGMRLVIAREPEPRELARLESLWTRASRYYVSHPDDARKLIAPAASTSADSTLAGSTTASATPTRSPSADSPSTSPTPASASSQTPAAATLSNRQSADLAAWTIIANVLLNLDEAQTRE